MSIKKVPFRIARLFETTTTHLLEHFPTLAYCGPTTIFQGDEKKNLRMCICCVPMRLTRLVGLNELKGLIGLVNREKALGLAGLQLARGAFLCYLS